MKNVKRTGSLLLALVIFVVALTGCSSNNGSSSSGGSSSAANSGQTSSADDTSADQTATGDAKYGGNITLAAEASPVTLYLPQSSSTNDRYYTAPAAEPLGREDDSGNVTPFLAEDFITDADALTFTIKLREDVYFHDDSVCDAEAVKWNLDMYIENGKGSELSNPTEVVAEDDLTVVVHFEEWSNNWDTVIGAIPIISKAAFDEHGEEWCKINIVGTGPFVLDSYVQDSSLRYVRNDNYRIEGQPYLDSFEFEVITDSNTVISAFLNQEIDALVTKDSVVIEQMVTAGFENVASKNANLADMQYVIMNSKDTSQPLGDLKVRQAVMHCIDWENVASSLSGGYGEATPLFCSPDSWAYHPDAEFYEYDIDLAKELLAEAGYPDGFSTKITTISSYNNVAVALQASLAQIGITTEIDVMDNSALAAMQVNDNIEGFIAWQGSSQMDFTANYIRLYSSEGIKNHGIIEYPADYEEALFGARSATTTEEKKELLQEAAKMLVQDYCLLFPLNLTYTMAYQQNDIHDLGYYATVATQFTPETAYRD